MTKKESSQRFWISLAVMSATIMQVLDTTIVNVALPHMQGQLGATPDQISWVLTSYLVMSGIFMPLTGYFSDKLGQKDYLLISILGFVVASALCGIATNLAEMVLFRLLQGMFGAALVPLSQSIMVQTFPANERGKAMAIWGVGVMVAPILGPTLGGYLTEALNWRWTFYINLPVGVFSLLLAWRLVPDTEKRQRGMDWIGLLLMTLATAGLMMAPRGIASMVSMILVGRLITRVEPRVLITIGTLLCGIGSYAMTKYSLYVDQWWLIWPIVVQGFGLGMVFVPLSTVAFTTLPREASAEAAGIFSLMRTVGSSIGISIVTTVMIRHMQIAWNEIGGHIQPFNPALAPYLSGLNLNMSDPAAAGILAQELARQAQMVGLLDAFMFITWSFVFMLPLVLLLRRSSRKPPAGAAVA